LKWFQFIPQFFFDAQYWNSAKKNLKQCNICGFYPNYWFPRGHDLPVLQKFKVIGGGKRYVDCPRCASSDRDRLVFQFLSEQEFHPQKNIKVLYVAPERPLFNAIKRKFNCEISGIDNRSKGYKFAYSHDVQLGDLRQLNFKDNSFDWIICNHVLEHILEEKQALLEINRVLKPDGIAIVQIPFSPILSGTIEAERNWDSRKRQELLGQWDHVRLYGNDFIDRWKSWGINVRLSDIQQSITNENYHLNPFEPIILIKKY
jgi:SAM-dependent methyltransferase